MYHSGSKPAAAPSEMGRGIRIDRLVRIGGQGESSQFVIGDAHAAVDVALHDDDRTSAVRSRYGGDHSDGCGAPHILGSQMHRTGAFHSGERLRACRRGDGRVRTAC